MKKPSYWDSHVDGYDLADFHDMEDVIIGWRDGLCIFGRLDDEQDVPAASVAKYARETAALLSDQSTLIAEKPKLLKLADYADKMALTELAERAVRKAVRKAVKQAVKAGLRDRDVLDMFHVYWSEEQQRIES